MLSTRRWLDEATLTRRPLRPFGQLVEVVTSGWTDGPARLADLPVEQLRDLVRQEGVLVLRGFAPLAREALAEYASTWGEILTWNFGQVLDLVVQEQPRNYLFTNGSVPFHWDGAFAQAVPSFLFFHCLQAPSPRTGGETLFCHTPRLWRNATAEQRQRWQRVVLSYETDKAAHYGGQITAPLLSRHPVTGETTLRFAEPPNETTADLNPLVVTGPEMPAEELDPLLRELRLALYDRRNCCAHAWQAGDYLVADNHTLLHGRNPFLTHSPRHLRRVHIL